MTLEIIYSVTYVRIKKLMWSPCYVLSVVELNPLEISFSTYWRTPNSFLLRVCRNLHSVSTHLNSHPKRYILLLRLCTGSKSRTVPVRTVPNKTLVIRWMKRRCEKKNYYYENCYNNNDDVDVTKKILTLFFDPL